MTVERNDTKFWVSLGRVPRIGRARFMLLEKHFGKMESAWSATAGELRSAGLDPGAISALLSVRDTISPDAEDEKLRKANVQAYTWNDPEYPPRLKEIYDKPPVLYVRGTLLAADEWAVSVVGTRRVSAYGRQVTEEMARGLSQNSITVVSGLARGIDTIAHKTALSTGGRTIAVLANGLDLVYPPENAKLAAQIAEHGALISDYPIGTQPRSEFFPRRNRIMSGISLGVLVVEGDLKSGALITAREALEQNREVFAVPGSIYSPNCRGTNAIIQEGQAKLVTKVENILEELNLTMAEHQIEAKALIPADETESLLLKHLSSEPIHVDEVRRETNLPIAAVSSALAMLELKGMVKQVGHMNYVRVREARVSYEA